MNFVLAVHGAPHSSNSGEHAIGFAKAAMAQGHHIERVFFYHDGVLHGLSSQVAPQSENDLCKAWSELADHGIELAVCIASAIKYN